MSADVTTLQTYGLDGRYRLLVDAITDYAIYMLPPEGEVSRWNADAQRIKRYEPSEIIGQRPHFGRSYHPLKLLKAVLPLR